MVATIAVIAAAPVHAQDGITVTKTAVVAKFPTGITYRISASSSAPITDIRLHYTVEQIDFADVTAEVFPEFQPAVSVTTEWTWDMRRTGGLPPGTLIDYWWTLKDSAGNTATTPRARLKFDDTRFNWKTIKGGSINIFWYEGSESFAQEILTASQQAADRLARDTGAALTQDVRIYIYASANDLRGSMIFPQEWTGGVAFTRFGTIAIGISTLNLTWGKRAISHELTHQITHQMTVNPYNDLPVWLDEGLAMVNEGPMETQFSSALKRAIDANKLFSVQTLSSPFSADADKSFLSYAESASVVDYLIRTYGKDKMLRLLETFSQGATYDGALQKVYGLDTRMLNAQWKKTVLGDKVTQDRRAPAPLPVAMVPVPALFGITLLLWRRAA